MSQKPRLYFLDLETTDLYADTGSILIACFCGPAGRMRTLRRDHYPGWQNRRDDDSGIIRALRQVFNDNDVIVAYNGRRFDVPFLQTRAMYHHLSFPKLRVVDPLLIVRRVMRLSRRPLANVATFLSLPPKFHLPIRAWKQATINGCQQSMDRLTTHCQGDVRTLIALTERLTNYYRPQERAWLKEVKWL